MAKQHVQGGAQGRSVRLERLEARGTTAHKIVGLRERVKQGLCSLDEAKAEVNGMPLGGSPSISAWLKRRKK